MSFQDNELPNPGDVGGIRLSSEDEATLRRLLDERQADHIADEMPATEAPQPLETKEGKQTIGFISKKFRNRIILTLVSGAVIVGAFEGTKNAVESLVPDVSLAEFVPEITPVPLEPVLQITEGAFEAVNQNISGNIPENVRQTQTIPMVLEPGRLRTFLETYLGMENGVLPGLTKAVRTDVDYLVWVGFENNGENDIQVTRENGQQIVTITYGSELSVFRAEDVQINRLEGIDSTIDQYLEYMPFVPGAVDISTVTERERVSALEDSRRAAVTQAMQSTEKISEARETMRENKIEEVTAILQATNPDVNFEVRVVFGDEVTENTEAAGTVETTTS